jgi:hypothetical protein
MFFFSRFVWLPLFFPCILSSIISLRFDMLMIRKASRFTHEILFCSASFSSPPPPPSPCLFVCLPFFVYSIRIPAGYTTSLGVCVCVCVFSPLCCCSSIHLFFGPIFINYLSCVVVWHSVYRWEKMRLSQTVYISSSLLNSHRKKKWFVRWGEKKWSIAKFNLIFLKKWTLSCIWLRA